MKLLREYETPFHHWLNIKPTGKDEIKNQFYYTVWNGLDEVHLREMLAVDYMCHLAPALHAVYAAGRTIREAV